MGRIIYDAGIFILMILVRFVALFNIKARLWLEGRRGIIERLKSEFNINQSDVVWVHCSSLGEFEQGRPLIEKIKSLHPEYKILLTFFSPSGYEIRKKYDKADWVFYLPVDTAGNAKKFFDITKPKLVVFVKYEYWYHFLGEAKSRNIPSFCISAYYIQGHHFFSKRGRFFADIMRNFNMIFVQDEQSKILLESIQISSIVAGDTRLDRVKDIFNAKKEIPQVDNFKGKSNLYIVGSSHQEDVLVLKDFLNTSAWASKGWKVIIVPHEIENDEIEFVIKNCPPDSTIRFSNLDSYNEQKHNILIVDNIGMLSSIYRYGAIAYIGGGFKQGVHNILEAAIYNIPAVYGPKFEKFNEAKEIIKFGGGFRIDNAQELTMMSEKMIDDSDYRENAGRRAGKYINDHLGATELIYNYIAHYFAPSQNTKI